MLSSDAWFCEAGWFTQQYLPLWPFHLLNSVRRWSQKTNLVNSIAPQAEFWSQTCFAWSTQCFLEGWISCQHKKKTPKNYHRNGHFTQECWFSASLESTMDSHGARQQWTGQVLSKSPLYYLSNPDLSASHFPTVLLLLFLTMELGRKGNASSEKNVSRTHVITVKARQ